MRILLLWQYYPPEAIGFATAVRGMAFARLLREAGHEVTVFAPFHAGLRDGHGEAGELVRRVVTFETLRDWLPAPLAIVVAPSAVLRMALEARSFRPDLIIVSQPSYTLPAQGLLVSKLTSARCVIDIEDVFLQDQWFAVGNVWRRLKLLVERLVTSHADAFFVVLPKMRDQLVRVHGVKPERSVILYNGFDGNRFPAFANESTKKTLDLLHLGSPRAYYDTPRLIEAFNRVIHHRPSARLVFTDCRDEPYVRSIQALVAELGLASSVDFLGQLSRDEILNLMQEARVGVYTLYPDESSKVIVGTKVFEYFAMGLPVAHLGFPGGSVQGILTEFDAGIVAFDPETFARETVRVLADSTRLEEMAENARRAAASFDWRVTIPRAFQMILEKVDGTPGRAMRHQLGSQ